jgi:hypothetical protein
MTGLARSVFCWFAFLFAGAAIAAPATFTVTNTNDSGPGSLRQAVLDANANAEGVGRDTIEFTGLTYPATITLTGPSLAVTGKLEVIGPGAAQLTISGNNSVNGLFNVPNGTSLNELRLNGLTLANAQRQTGGAVFGQGPDSVNTVRSVIYVFDCVFNQNKNHVYLDFQNNIQPDTNSSGGAISASGDLYIYRTTFSNNQSGGNGGGAVEFRGGNLLVFDSTFFNNETENLGGAVYIVSTGPGGRGFWNSTFSGNRARGGNGGGAVMIRGVSPETVQTFGFYNATFVNNAATAAGTGGALDFDADPTTDLVMSSVLFGGNTSDGVARDVRVSAASNFTARHSLFQGHANAASAGIDVGTNNLFAVDPLVAAITNNGGSTRTHALNAGSPAINAGAVEVATSDQRSPGFPRVVGVASDIGAFEFGTARPYTLTSSKVGPGNGLVSTYNGNINCGSTCAAIYAADMTVNLLAYAHPGSVFAGWSGACSGTGSCTVTMNQSRSVTAQFNIADAPGGQPLAVTVVGPGSVQSSPAGISCGVACTHAFATGTEVTLVATGPTFSGWTGACTGAGNCTVTMSQARTVGAYFSEPTAPPVLLSVTRSGTGTGTVNASLTGLICGNDCSESYPLNSLIELTASASPGSSFVGWSGGGCSGTAPCWVPMTTARTINAEFSVAPVIVQPAQPVPVGSPAVLGLLGLLVCGLAGLGMRRTLVDAARGNK